MPKIGLHNLESAAFALLALLSLLWVIRGHMARQNRTIKLDSLLLRYCALIIFALLAVAWYFGRYMHLNLG